MRNKYISLILVVCLLFSGCAWVHSTSQNTKNQDALAKTVQKAAISKDELNKFDQERISQVASYSFGVNYTLTQLTNPPVQVATALQLNNRVISLVGSPDLDDVKKITAIVDLMNSEVASEKLKGQKLLDKRDKEITELQSSIADLKIKHNKQIGDLITKSEAIAKKGDEAQTTIDSMSGFMGLNAVWWGLKHFFFSCLTYILVFGVIFFVLRAFAGTNPVVGAIFSIFELIGSTAISVIKGLAPKSVDFSNLVHADTHNTYKNTLNKIVDIVEQMKAKQKASNKEYTLTEVLDQLDRSMDQSDKDCVDEILKNHKWS